MTLKQIELMCNHNAVVHCKNRNEIYLFYKSTIYKDAYRVLCYQTKTKKFNHACVADAMFNAKKFCVGDYVCSDAYVYIDDSEINFVKCSKDYSKVSSHDIEVFVPVNNPILAELFVATFSEVERQSQKERVQLSDFLNQLQHQHKAVPSQTLKEAISAQPSNNAADASLQKKAGLKI